MGSFYPTVRDQSGAQDAPPTRDIFAKKATGAADWQPDAEFQDPDLLELYKSCKKESFDQRWVFERQWLRNIYYVLNRQWIYYNSRVGEWQDKRLAKWIPRPVTNICKEAVQSIRSMFSAIKLGVNVRPNGQAPENVTAANTADELAPLLHEEHQMNAVQNEFDWWLIVTGNAFIHTYMEYDQKHGEIVIPYEQCVQCQNVVPSTELVGAQPVCPTCQGTQFQPAVDPITGEPVEERKPEGRGVTTALSPLELAFPYSYPRFSDVPYVIRLRWRTRKYYENHPEFAEQVAQVKWQKTPSDRSLQIFKALAQQNDLGLSPHSYSSGSGGGTDEEEGATEHEVWYKPTSQYPKGLVMRVIDAQSPIILHSERENLPGPLPYVDAKGKPLFTFSHAAYEHVGGRVLGSGALDVVIQKQDQINQLDSMIQMIIQRMANPVWLEPKGAEVEKFTGEPGLVVKWNPLLVNGNAKPERIAGEGPHGSFFQIREMLFKDAENLLGTFDIMKGGKPPGVDSFSGLQLMMEAGQKRFATAFTGRGEVYKDWFKFAIELEREFGPDERTKSVLNPNRGYTFKTFKNAQLQGSTTIVVEDGTQTPKTTLGIRAAVEHASGLGMLNMQDPDQQYEGLKLFGLQKLVPAMDSHKQAALQKQQDFEEFIASPEQQQQAVALNDQDEAKYATDMNTAMAQPPVVDPTTGMAAPPQLPEQPSVLAHTPLKWKLWYDATIHKMEFMKWVNSDRMREVLRQAPWAEQFLEVHMMEMDQALAEMAMQQAMMQGGPAGPPEQGAPNETPDSGGSKQAMSNANKAGNGGNKKK